MKVQCILCFFLLSELFVMPVVVHGKPVKGKKLVEKRSTSGDLARTAVLGAVSAKLHGGSRQQNYEPPQNHSNRILLYGTNN
uniref:Secreted protein n=1 Tax=Globodera rostochiensis TaxID=31243 RepID=A0A914HXI4_GLORO